MGKRKRPLGIISARQTTIRCAKRPCLPMKKTTSRKKKRRRQPTTFQKPRQSRFVGVRWDKSKKQWKAVVNGETLGYFDADDEINAGRAVEARNDLLGRKSRNPKLLKYSYRCCGWPWEDSPPDWDDVDAVQCEWCEFWWHTKCLRDFRIFKIPKTDFECPHLPNDVKPPEFEPMTHSRKCGVFYRDQKWHSLVVPWRRKRNGDWASSKIEHLGPFGKEILAARAASMRRSHLRKNAGVPERIIRPEPLEKNTAKDKEETPEHESEPESEELEEPPEPSPEPEEDIKMLEQRLGELQSELDETNEKINALDPVDIIEELTDKIDCFLPMDKRSRKKPRPRKKKKKTKPKPKVKPMSKARPKPMPLNSLETRKDPFSPPVTEKFLPMAKFEQHFTFMTYFEWHLYWERCFSKRYDRREHRSLSKEYANKSFEDSAFEALWKKAKKKRNEELALMYLRVYQLWSSEPCLVERPWRVKAKIK